MSDDQSAIRSKVSAVKRGWGHWRDRLRKRPKAEFTYRIGVAVVGLTVLGVGIVAIPYPGPGWAIVFIGLGILATEFEWARRLLAYAKYRYDKVMDWFHSQGLWVQILGGAVTALIVAVTLWLVGALDWTAELVGVEHPWLNSPIGVGD
ncbi:TIGR02611 family protein [Mycolicibacterium agri]|uniref:TIGR02611 family protein n=1 Tax=Mycolicibacterium agri TaxID=36811 RepID=A0A2A7MS57_MYCAG|nr:TIGR02611 family protein [Mycolicibacterium agri]PEG34333.1 TIGR02611 family protein [Mycolicibacterium agri]GFG49420.1 TIGR02611 family protein [Mycolicibacterium agri]